MKKTTLALMICLLVGSVSMAQEEPNRFYSLIDTDDVFPYNLQLYNLNHQLIIVPLDARLRALVLPGHKKLDLFQWDADASRVRDAYYGYYQGDLVTLDLLNGPGQETWAELARFHPKDLKPRWMTRIHLSDIGLPAMDKDFVYTAGDNEVAKYDLRDGKELWSMDWPFPKGEQQFFEQPEIGQGRVIFTDSYDRKLVLNDSTGYLFLKDDSSMRETTLTRHPDRFLMMTAFGGYDVFELFQDKNPTMGWVNTGLWSAGLLIEAVMPSRSLRWRDNTLNAFLLYDFTYSIGYPIVTLLDGSGNAEGKVDRAWIGLGLSYALFLGLERFGGNSNDDHKRAEIAPVVKPNYSGLAWFKEF